MLYLPYLTRLSWWFDVASFPLGPGNLLQQMTPLTELFCAQSDAKADNRKAKDRYTC
jgi:hypothetical protein